MYVKDFVSAQMIVSLGRAALAMSPTLHLHTACLVCPTTVPGGDAHVQHCRGCSSQCLWSGPFQFGVSVTLIGNCRFRIEGFGP